MAKNDHTLFPSPCACPLHLPFVVPTVRERESSSRPLVSVLGRGPESRLESAGACLPLLSALACGDHPGHPASEEGWAGPWGQEAARWRRALQVQPWPEPWSDTGQPHWTSRPGRSRPTAASQQEALRVVWSHKGLLVWATRFGGRRQKLGDTDTCQLLTGQDTVALSVNRAWEVVP